MYLDFVSYRCGASNVWIDPRFADPATLAQFDDVDRLWRLPGCQIVKDQKKIKVGRVILNLGGRASPVFIKRYNLHSVRHRVGAMFAKSSALRALRGAAILQSAQIGIPEPIAVVENQPLRGDGGSFFITREVVNGQTADLYWQGELSCGDRKRIWVKRRRFLEQLAALFRSLHDAHIYHNDLKDVNILVVPDASGETESFVLLDLEGVQQCDPLSVRRQRKNLVQLNRTLGERVSKSLRWYFLREYFGGRLRDRQDLRAWGAAIQSESERINAVRRPQIH